MTNDSLGETLQDLATGLVKDLAGDGDIDVTSWTDLAGLPDDMGVLAEQYATITRHAVQWVCRRAGFEPSPVCLLRPLGEVVDLVAGAFEAVGRSVADEWGDLQQAVAATTRDMITIDQMVADWMPVVS